jgi:hypothetical protein
MLATDMKSLSLKDFAPLMNIIRKTAQQLAVLQVAGSQGNGEHARAWIEKLNTTFDFEATLVTTDAPLAEQGIEEAIRENKVDFLFAIQQQGLFERIFNGDKLPPVVHAGVPVLLVRK